MNQSYKRLGIYVYKKTIFEILNDNKKQKETDEENDKNKFILIEKYIRIYKSILIRFFENINIINNESNFIDKFQVLCEKLNILKLDIDKINKLQCLSDKLISSIKDPTLLFDVIFNMLSKLSKNTNIVLKKYVENITDEKIHELLENENHILFIENILK